jgi:hypothetical protein
MRRLRLWGLGWFGLGVSEDLKKSGTPFGAGHAARKALEECEVPVQAVL